ncbi:carbon-nitrogen hydrolase [Aspergillus unguis]
MYVANQPTSSSTNIRKSTTLTFLPPHEKARRNPKPVFKIASALQSPLRVGAVQHRALRGLTVSSLIEPSASTSRSGRYQNRSLSRGAGGEKIQRSFCDYRKIVCLPAGTSKRNLTCNQTLSLKKKGPTSGGVQFPATVRALSTGPLSLARRLLQSVGLGREPNPKPGLVPTLVPRPSKPQNKNMRIATLQIASKLGDIEANIERADELLDKGIITPDGGSLRVEDARLDMLVLSELALTGYNFPSLDAIRPYLEPAGQGPCASWARQTAKRIGCKVCVGYPEIEADANDQTEKYYNSLLVVDEEGTVLVNYRKTFLYYTDETWASEGQAELGFHQLTFPTPTEDDCSSSGKAIAEGEAAIIPKTSSATKSDSVATSFGICMDINPYKFEAPYTAFEFAHRVLDSKSELVILSMAWLTLLSRAELDALSGRPEIDTFNYWIQRFMPLLREKMRHSSANSNKEEGDSDEKRIIIVFANRAGEEEGSPSPARYAGTSSIVAISQRRSDALRRHDPLLDNENDNENDEALDVKILCWDMLGATEEGLCFADTAGDPKMVFQLVKRG